MSLEEKYKQLAEENEKLKSENEELKSQIADLNNNNKKNNTRNHEISELFDQIKNIDDKIVDLRNINSGILYLETLNELRQKEKELLEAKQELNDRISKLEQQVNDNKVESHKQVVKETNKEKVEKINEPTQEETETLETLDEIISDEKDDDVIVEQLEEKEEPTIETLSEEILDESQDDLTEGFMEVIQRDIVDDLTLSNATTALQNVPDDLVFKEEEEEKPKFQVVEEDEVENTEVETPVTPTNEIEEITEEVMEETPQAVVSQEEVAAPAIPVLGEQVPLNEAVTPQIAESIKYLDENIKAGKEFVSNIVKKITERLQTNTEADIKDIPESRKESFDNNLIVMPEVLGTEEAQLTR